MLCIESDCKFMYLCQIFIAIYFYLDISCYCDWLLEVFSFRSRVVIPATDASL